MTLTAAEVVTLVEANHLELTTGMVLLDETGADIVDISTDVKNVSVERDITRRIHAGCKFRTVKELDWPAQRVRPYVTLTSDRLDLSETWNMGVYVMETPIREAGSTPRAWTVECFDQLRVLDTPHGASYVAASGDVYLDLVTDLITDGDPAASVTLDSTAATTTLPSARAWTLETPTLDIVNDLLAAVGYRRLWTDRDGRYRSGPAIASGSITPTYTIRGDTKTRTVLTENRRSFQDLYPVPNVWVFVNDDAANDVPDEGNGRYTVPNDADGPTSIAARGGQERRKIVRLDAVDQSALVTQGNRIVEADKQIATQVDCVTSPLPQLWHFSTVNLNDSDLSVTGAHIVTEWSMELGQSSHKLTLRKAFT